MCCGGTQTRQRRAWRPLPPSRKMCGHWGCALVCLLAKCPFWVGLWLLGRQKRPLACLLPANALGLFITTCTCCPAAVLLCPALLQVIVEPAARAAYLWVVGEYGARIQVCPLGAKKPCPCCIRRAGNSVSPWPLPTGSRIREGNLHAAPDLPTPAMLCSCGRPAAGCALCAGGLLRQLCRGGAGGQGGPPDCSPQALLQAPTRVQARQQLYLSWLGIACAGTLQYLPSAEGAAHIVGRSVTNLPTCPPPPAGRH